MPPTPGTFNKKILPIHPDYTGPGDPYYNERSGLIVLDGPRGPLLARYHSDKYPDPERFKFLCAFNPDYTVFEGPAAPDRATPDIIAYAFPIERHNDPVEGVSSGAGGSMFAKGPRIFDGEGSHGGSPRFPRYSELFCRLQLPDHRPRTPKRASTKTAPANPCMLDGGMSPLRPLGHACSGPAYSTHKRPFRPSLQPRFYRALGGPPREKSPSREEPPPAKSRARDVPSWRAFPRRYHSQALP